MKVLFLVPPDTLSIESSVPDQLEKRKEFRQRLGLLSVAAHMEQATGVRPQFVDISVLGNTYRCLEDELELLPDPDVVGLSVLTFNMLDARQTARMVRARFPRAKIVAGGHHATLYPRETLGLPEIDYVVSGEGERVFTRLVNELRERGDSPRAEVLDAIGGLGWKDGGKPRFNPIKDEGVDFDALPAPAHHLIDLTKYNNVLARQAHTASVQSSRGCPAACTFCDIRKTKFRARSPENVVRELKALAELGTRDFFFVDDTMTIDRRRVLAICDLIVKEKLEIEFKISSRTDTISPEVVAALKRAGCYRIHYGVESVTPRLLRYLEKGSTPERVRRAFKITREAGIQTYAYMMIGIPTETREEMWASVDYVTKALKADYAQFSILTPYPKTALYERMLQDGIVSHDYWQDFAVDPQPGFKVRFWNKDFTEDDLRTLQDEAMRRFYGRRDYIVNELRKIRSMGELVTKARVGARVLLPRIMRAVDRATAAFEELRGGTFVPPAPGPRNLAGLRTPVSAHAGGDGS
ncbi:B12-binding domain-containing radical SAM protein [bacterium]|nr:B12-binding domain-containing radical SAM protein [bacterium]